MQMTSHNGLKVKQKLAPKDYKKDPNCRVRHPKTGLDVTLPTEVIKLLRSGEARFI